MYYFTEYDSPLGLLTLGSDGEAICGLWLEGQKYHGDTIPEKMVRNDDATGFDELRTWLDGYFAGENPSVSDLPLAPIGGEFRQAVWQKLLEIPYGELTTYGAISNELKAEGRKAAAIAVGGAVGHNPISIIIPCHRVVGASGSLTGYGGGIKRKIWLLERDGINMSKLSIPEKGQLCNAMLK